MVVSDGSSLTMRIISPFAEELNGLRTRLAGSVSTVDDPTYDAARGAINITEDHRPLAVVQAVHEHDVVEAVKFVRQHGLSLAIRSGGHGMAGHALVDGAILIDLGQMSHVTVDPIARTARVQPGATSAVVGAAAHEHGLALTTGDTQSVGMGGLATGGGIGFMARAYGLTIDNMLSARVVTANGEVLVANPIEHPDLFWAIRGGGGNFGIVTEFTFRLGPIDHILGGALVLPATREVLRGYLDYAASAPDDLTTIAHVMHCPPMPFVPGDRVGEPVLAILVCWSGTREAGEAALAPLRALATPVAEAISVMPYPDIYRFTEHQAQPHAASVRMMFADDLSDTALDAVLDAIDNVSSPFSLVQFRAMGGAVARVDQNATAFIHRDQRYFVSIIGLWVDPTDDGAAHRAWTEKIWQAIRGEGRGVYVNFLQDEGEGRIREAYGETAYDRLARIKTFYDPENIFRHCQNIKPAS